jgi:hypothetical protein
LRESIANVQRRLAGGRARAAISALQQGQHDDRRVINVGIRIVVELEGPAIALGLAALHPPIAWRVVGNLLAQQPRYRP